MNKHRLSTVVMTLVPALLAGCASLPGSPEKTSMVDRDPSRARPDGLFVLGSKAEGRGADPSGYVPRVQREAARKQAEKQPEPAKQEPVAQAQPAPEQPSEVPALPAEPERVETSQAAPAAPVRLSLSDKLLFPVGKAELSEQGRKELDAWADQLKRVQGAKVEIAGHTDATGSAELNRKLSLQRAETVRDYLVSQGVSQEQLTARGYAARIPVATNKTEAGRAKNRRVEARY